MTQDSCESDPSDGQACPPGEAARWRRLECIRLRIQDVDCGQNLLVVRGSKGGQDRTTILPRNLREE